MLHLELNFEDGSQRFFQATLPVSIGRAVDCGLRIRAWRVGRYHATIERRSAGLFIDDLGTLGGTFVNGHRVTQYGPLDVSDEIIIGPCMMRMVDPYRTPPSTEWGPGSNMQAHVPIHVQASSQPDDVHVSCGPGHGEEHVLMHGGSLSGGVPFPEPDGDENGKKSCVQPGDSGLVDEYIKCCRRLHGALVEALDLRRRDIAAMTDCALRAEASDVLAGIIARDDDLPAAIDREQLIRAVVDEAVGLGPLEPLLADTRVSEIMVNRHDEIFVESAGQLHRHQGGFSSEQAVLGVIERIVSPLGRRIDESSPMVDARLNDGSRVNAVIPPVALRGASITIRKFPATRPQMADLLRVGALDLHMSRFLTQCVVQRKNIIVSGGTGSGKTTLLNILSACIPPGERIVTIEDAAELQLAHEHLVSLEARPANLEGRGAVLIRDLVRNALRMRPDRIVVGECRGAEAFDMLAAMNTGHEGSLTTLHANSPRDALNRLETMVLMAGLDLPLSAVREHVCSSVDILVQQARLSSGHRVITSVVQVTGQESGRIQLQELFSFQSGPPAVFSGCGIVPDGISLVGSGLGIDIFNQRTDAVFSSLGW